MSESSNIDETARPSIDSLSARDQEILAIKEGIDAMNRGEMMPLRDFDRAFRELDGIAFER